MVSSLERHWPLFRLRLRTARLELRVPGDDDLAALVDLAAAGVHPPDEMPFVFPWTRAEPPRLQRAALQYHWGRRVEWRPEAWTAELVVVRDRQVVGAQGLGAKEFPVSRSVSSGSWLGRAHQGQGLGREMRAAVLHLAFAGLGALEARSAAFADNLASAAVSRRLGYELDGTEIHVVEGVRRVAHRFLLTRERWEATDRIPVEVEGLEPCLALFGLG